MDAIAPDALAIEDVTDWLRAGCVYRAVLPENHIAFKYAHEKAIPIWGTRTPPSPSEYEQTREAIHRMNEQYADLNGVERAYRPTLDGTTARIAREFSFNPDPQTLGSLLRSGFAARAATWTPTRREATLSAARKIVDSLVPLVVANPQRRWAVLLPWENALGTAELLREQSGIRYRPVDEFLAAADGALAKRMDAGNVSWILSGMFPFPINGKWIRPPWSSVQKKGRPPVRRRAVATISERFGLCDLRSDEAVRPSDPT